MIFIRAYTEFADVDYPIFWGLFLESQSSIGSRKDKKNTEDHKIFKS
jgi:hypothetical protein